MTTTDMGSFDWIRDYDHLGGDFRRFHQVTEAGKKAILLGAPLPIRYLLAAACRRHLIFVTPDMACAAKAFSALSCFRDDVILLGAKYDYLSYKSVVLDSALTRRIKAMYSLATGDFGIMIADVDSLLHYLPSKELFLSLSQRIVVGEEIDYDAFISRLTSGGYKRQETVSGEGTFSAKGDIIDVFSVGETMPYRILLFDSVVESIKQFNVNSMTSVGNLDSVTILPASDIFVPESAITEALGILRMTIDHTPNAPTLNTIYEDIAMRVVSNNGSQALWWLSPFLSTHMVGFADYLPDDTIVWYEEGRQIEDAVEVEESARSIQIRSLLSMHEITEAHRRYRPAFSTLRSELSVYGEAVSIPPITLQSLITEGEPFIFNTNPIPRYYSGDSNFAEDMNRYQYSGHDVVVCCGAPVQAQNICEILRQHDVAARYVDEYNGEHGIMVTPLSIEYGYNIPDCKLVVIGTRDINAQSTSNNAVRRIRVATTCPEKGDYVVHEVHGIGKCLGVEPVTIHGLTRDYVVVEYKGDAKLYVPVENLGRLSKYVATTKTPPTLNSLGGRAFEKTVEHVRESLKELSFDLLEVYADRAKLKGYKYSKDTSLQREFEDSFQFVETTDQLKAISEIKYDLEAGKIMDRLLCGDVGFGKTEVALRAIFKVVQDGKQCAFLAPTTLLALQHYNLVRDRFASFGVECELFCRLRKPADIKNSLKRLKEGKIDVAIGTHRLLSADVEFRDLGLLVLDEEQRFGVEHKEKIKAMRHSVNVLSLSATPIPRTLHMTLNGIRDISLLETPPVDRLPVQTFVSEYSDGLVIDTVTKELSRGGQVFILYNFIDALDAYYSRLCAMFPDARIVTAHGQMDSATLEERIGAFYNREADILLCTTIIENGIDLPDANTLIVINADRLGLSQLYQIRGRVGRSNRLGYAYFTVNSQLLISGDAEKRLAALMENTSLGSGYKIAMADLEIRGAGDILGARQSGHIAKIGYDFYCKLLSEEIDKLRGEEHEELPDTEISIPLDFSVPDSVAAALGGKLRLYKRISEIDTPDALVRLSEEYAAMVPKLPEGLINLMRVALLKNLCSELYITKVTFTADGIFATFRDAEAIKNERLLRVISDNAKVASIDLSNGAVRLVVRHSKSDIKEKLKYFTKFVLLSLQMLRKKD